MPPATASTILEPPIETASRPDRAQAAPPPAAEPLPFLEKRPTVPVIEPGPGPHPRVPMGHPRVPAAPQPVGRPGPSPSGRPSVEQGRYKPRFRVVMRRPLPAVRKSAFGDPLQQGLVLAAFPAFCLLAYVLFWTLALRGGYYRSQLQGQIRTLRIERAELEAEKRRLQSPGIILQRARAELGMEPAPEREFARLPVAQHIAQRDGALQTTR